MHYFIDGYNLLFRFLKDKSNLEAQRREFIADLDEIAKILGLDATIVFDGHFSEEGYSRGHTRSLEIIYTGFGESADALILSEIEMSPHPSRETVVTSDRDLAYKARKMRAKTESAEEFFTRVVKQAGKRQKKEPPLPRAEPKKKTVEHTTEGLDELDQYLLEAFEKKMKEEKIEIFRHRDPVYEDFQRWLRIFEEGSSSS